MMVRCIKKTGASLGKPQRGHFYGIDTVFNLEVGSVYPILGMGIFETLLVALVCDETEKPNWLPVALFDFGIQRMPSWWEFVLLDGPAGSGGDSANRWVAKCGYRELVRDPAHGDRLIERDPSALAIFFRELARHKEESDRYSLDPSGSPAVRGPGGQV